MIRSVSISDAQQICEIYNYYVDNSVVSFETEQVSVEEMVQRIESKTKVYPWIVYEDAGIILGYAYAGKWRERAAYKNTVEASVYLAQKAIGKGIGYALYDPLMGKIKSGGFHSVLGCIALPNEASIALHEKLGFKKIAHFTEVGQKFNRWVDVGYYELIIKS